MHERAAGAVEHMAARGINRQPDPLMWKGRVTAPYLRDCALALIEIDVHQRQRTEPFDEANGARERARGIGM